MLSPIENPPYPIPENERERLQALLETDLLNSPEEPLYNRITTLAKDHLGVATTLISLVEKDRQWFKAKCGLDVAQTPRDMAFCSYTILKREVMVVPDAQADERFRENDLVTGPPFIRFYAGAPIIINQRYAIGTLCVIDKKPWPEMKPEQRMFLQEMASILSIMIEHRMDRMHNEPAV